MAIITLAEAKAIGYKRIYFTFDCVGDTLLLMAALEYLYNATGKKILIGTAYHELIENCTYLDVLEGFSEDAFNTETYADLLSADIEPVFITGTKFIESEGKVRPAWGDQHILVNVCNKIGVETPISVKTQMFLTEQEKLYGRFFSKKQIAITGAGWQKYKTIPFDTLQDVVNQLKEKYSFVQIGHPNDPLLEGVLDMRQEGGLRKTAAILHNSDALLCGIGGMMHMARAVNCRAVVGFTYAEPLRLENYICNINVFARGQVCKLCGENNEFPYLVHCTHNFSCVRGICAQDLCNALELQLEKQGQDLETEVVTANPMPVVGIEDYIKRFSKIPDKN